MGDGAQKSPAKAGLSRLLCPQTLPLSRPAGFVGRESAAPPDTN
jgi:hypothetical protein